MTRSSSICIAPALALLAVAGQDSPKQLSNPIAETAALTRARSSEAASITFVRPPRWRRIRQESEVYMGGDISITADIVVRDAEERTIAGLPVRLFVRSDAGPTGIGDTLTGSGGEAHLEVIFAISPGSLSGTAQACTTTAEVCTPPHPLKFTRRMDVQVASDSSYSVYRDKVAIKAGTSDVQLPYTYNNFQLILTPQVQWNLWEREKSFKYYCWSVNASLPLLFQNHTLASILRTKTVDQGLGVGDFSVGTTLQMPKLGFSASYNGRNSRLNLLDSMRDLGLARPLNVGDGFQSIDLSALVAHRFARGPLFSLQVNTSHASHRRFADGAVGAKNPYYGATASATFIRKSQHFGVVPWVTFAHHGRMTLTSRRHNPGSCRAG